MNPAATPVWVPYVAVAVLGVLLGRWTKAMRWIGERHRASHVAARGQADSKAGAAGGSAEVNFYVGHGAGAGNAHVENGTLGRSDSADVFGGPLGSVYRRISDRAPLDAPLSIGQADGWHELEFARELGPHVAGELALHGLIDSVEWLEGDDGRTLIARSRMPRSASGDTPNNSTGGR